MRESRREILIEKEGAEETGTDAQDTYFESMATQRAKHAGTFMECIITASG